MEQAAGCEPGILIILSYLAEMRVTREQLRTSHVLPLIDSLRQVQTTPPGLPRIVFGLLQRVVLCGKECRTALNPLYHILSLSGGPS